MPRDQFESQNTLQFTWVASVAPDSAPILKITGVDGSTVTSLTSISSDSTSYYALYTLPNTQGICMGEWYAEKTVSSSVRPFIKRFVFNIVPTKQFF